MTMRTRFPSQSRVRLICAMTLACADVARADSGVGVDTWLANAYSADAGAVTIGADWRGTSWLSPLQRRSPSGNLYLCPAQSPRTTPNGEWTHDGIVELGAVSLHGGAESSLWNRYVDWDSGLVLGLLDLRFARADDGAYANLRASRISDDDAYFQALFGRAGSYKVRAFVRKLPNVLADQVRSIWDGVGSDRLTLVEGLEAAASSSEEVAAVSQAAPNRRLSVTRTRQGLAYSVWLDPRWTAYADLSHEEREGARPFGGPFFFNFPFPDNGGVLETLRPVDDSTLNFNGGLRFAGALWRMDVGYSGSLYRDRHTRYTYEMPFALTPVLPGAQSAPLTTGQFATEPDNDYHNLRIALTRRIPLNGELSLSASLGRMSQNDRLIAPIDCQGVFGIGVDGSLEPGAQNPLLFDCAQWNSSAALSRERAGMRIDTSLFDARVIVQPHSSMTARAGLRFNREDYRNTYLAYNPINGAYGYVAENGAQGSVVPGEIGFWYPGAGASNLTRIRSLALDRQSIEANLGVDWKPAEDNTFGFEIALLRAEPTHRERRQVDDRRLKISWVNRALDWLTLRANVSHLRRSGDRYIADPYEFTFSSSLPGFVAPLGGVPAHTVDVLRKYDLGNRDEYRYNLMATLIPHEDMTVTASLRGNLNDYDAVLGRQRYDTLGATLQWEWQPAPQTRASAYLGYDRSTLALANVNDLSVGPDPAFGGSTYPLESLWSAEDRQRNRSAGATFQQDFARLRFDADWSWLDARGITAYGFATPAALAYFGDGVSVPGNVFPPLRYRVNSLVLGLTMPLGERISLRLFDSFARGDIRDWHYDGLDTQRVLDHRVYSDGGPRDYRANLIGLLLSVRL
jgi:hypothetical protein